ncbi:MAG: hypothetical protein ABJR07_03440, partial [Lentilitoribacter sp.]
IWPCGKHRDITGVRPLAEHSRVAVKWDRCFTLALYQGCFPFLRDPAAKNLVMRIKQHNLSAATPLIFYLRVFFLTSYRLQTGVRKVSLNPTQLNLLTTQFFNENSDQNALRNNLERGLFKKFDNIVVMGQGKELPMGHQNFLNQRREFQVNLYIAQTNQRIERQLEEISGLKELWQALPITYKEQNQAAFDDLLKNVFRKFDAWRDENETNRTLWQDLLQTGNAKNFDFDKFKISLRTKFQEYLNALHDLMNFFAAHQNTHIDALTQRPFEAPKDEEPVPPMPATPPETTFNVKSFQNRVANLIEENEKLHDDRLDKSLHIPKPVAKERIDWNQMDWGRDDEESVEITAPVVG